MPDSNASPASLPREERLLRSRLHQLLSQAEGFLHGSLIEMARRCGNPNCRCAKEDQYKHRSPYLGQTRKGKSSMIYLGKDLEAQVGQWIDHYQEAIALLEELNQQARARIEQLKASKRSARKAARAKRGKKKISKPKPKPKPKGGAKKTTTKNPSPPKPS